jgi:UDP-glucose 4-epimerase
MSILVTGGAGYIGSHMVHRLVDARERVVVIDDLTTGFDWLLPADVPLVVGDIGDAALLQQVISTHAVREIVHFAGSVVVPESVSDPLRYYLNNTVKSRTLIEAAVRTGVPRFIFSSTAAVYGNPLQVPVSEDSITQPISPYGSSKLMTETMLRDASAAHGLSHVILRYFNVAGADPGLRTGQATQGATHLIKVAVQAALGIRPSLNVFGTDYPTSDGTCIRDYIHVSDLVQAHSDAVRYLRAGEDSVTLNCGYGKGYSVLDVIATAKQVSGVDFPVVYSPRRAGDPDRIVAAADRLKALLGWKPDREDLSVIVRDAFAWEKLLQSRQRGADLSRPSA